MQLRDEVVIADALIVAQIFCILAKCRKRPFASVLRYALLLLFGPPGGLPVFGIVLVALSRRTICGIPCTTIVAQSQQGLCSSPMIWGPSEFLPWRDYSSGTMRESRSLVRMNCTTKLVMGTFW